MKGQLGASSDGVQREGWALEGKNQETMTSPDGRRAGPQGKGGDGLKSHVCVTETCVACSVRGSSDEFCSAGQRTVVLRRRLARPFVGPGVSPVPVVLYRTISPF